MSVNRNKSDDLKGVQMIEKEEEKDKYRVYAEVSPLRHLRPKRSQEKPGGLTCRKRTYRFFSIIISYTHANTHTHSKADLQVV
jgi:hypothetical protein